MSTAPQRAKNGTRRAKAVSGGAKAKAARVGADFGEALLERVFAELGDTPPTTGAVPEVVRKNRRERARRRLSDALASRGPYPVSELLRGELYALVERWARKGFEDAFTDADDFEIRCADERAILEAEARGDEEERFKAAERSYLREVEKRHGKIEIRGLQLSARVHQDVEIAYVPLHVEGPPETPVVHLAKPKGGAKAKSVDEEAVAQMLRALERPRMPVARALGEHPRIVLVGEPGSGKSTLLAYLATCAARGVLAAESGLKEELVPFLVPMRSLHELPEKPEALARSAGAEPWFLEAALRRGRALLLVDGLDEARREIAPDRLLDALATTLNTYPGTRVLVTTRPSGGLGEDGRAPRGFVPMTLTAMTRGEVSTFIDRWCLAAELSLPKPRSQAEADASAAAEDLKDRVRASRQIEKLAETPLLCSVICVVHRFLGQRIPERRVALYEAITNVLLYEWDRAKFPEGAAAGKLDAHAKRALLARLARSMHEARVAELPADQVIRRFAAHLPDLGWPAEDAAKIVAEIRDRDGVLVERAPGLFGFSHLTFQEYLAALEMVNTHAYDLLLRNHKDNWWQEVIVLAAGFPGADAARLVRGLLNADAEEVAEGTMLAAQCAETAVDLRQSLRNEIDARVARLVPPKNGSDLNRIKELGELAGPALLRSLGIVDVNGRAAILRALSGISYEPAIGPVRRLMRDTSRTTAKTVAGNAGSQLGMEAVRTMFLMALTLGAAFAVFMEDSAPTGPSPYKVLVRELRKFLLKHGAPTFASSATPLSKRAARSG